MIKRKRGQLGKTVSWFPVFLFLIVLITIYMIMIFPLTATKNPAKIHFYGVDEKGPLLHLFDFGGKKLMVFDSLFQMGGLDKEGKDKEMYDAVAREITELSKRDIEEGEGKCILISTPFAYFFAGRGNFNPAKDYQLPRYRDEKGYYEILVKKEGLEYQIDYYEGRCVK